MLLLEPEQSFSNMHLLRFSAHLHKQSDIAGVHSSPCLTL